MTTKVSYAVTENLTDEQLKKEYSRMNKDVLVEMIINQERVIQALIEPHLRRYEMGLTKNSSTTYGSTT